VIAERGRRLLARASAPVLALLLAGCTGSAAGGTAPPLPSPTDVPVTAPATPPDSPTPTASNTTSPRVTPGTIDQTVAPREQKTAKPVQLDKPQRDGQVEVKLVSIKSRKVKAVGPGEVGGSALVVTVRITNGTRDDLEVDGTYVTVIDSKGNTGIGLTNDPSSPLIEPILPGKSETGVYVFRVPTKARSNIRVFVTYSPDHETAVFVGDAS
jgi:hypothetical protein